MCRVYIYLLHKDTRTLAKSFACLTFFCEKLEDIQMTLQLSKCLFATNICGKKKKKISTCDFMLMQYNSHSDKVSL